MRIAIAGLGTVGAEVARLLLDGRNQPGESEMRLVAVSARNQKRDRGFPMDGIEFHADAGALASLENIDCVVELIGGEDGVSLALVEAAIANGKSVVTANKALLAKHGVRLAKAAEEAGVALCAEASVAAGIPCLKVLREGLAANTIERVSGILNGTCNYILSEMSSEGRDFAAVLEEAQKLGYAEADPSFDINGTDTAHKLALLSAIAFGIEPDVEAIDIRGIHTLSAIDIGCANELGYAIRLLGIAEYTEAGIDLSVQPTMVPASSQLAKVDGTLNAVAIDSQPAGIVTMIGAGAGAGPTASAVLADLNDIACGRTTAFFGRPAKALIPSGKAVNAATDMCYYVRLTALDKPGALADVTAVLRNHSISVESILQYGRAAGEGGGVPVVLTSHEISSTALAAAVEEITSLDVILESPVVMAIANNG